MSPRQTERIRQKWPFFILHNVSGDFQVSLNYREIPQKAIDAGFMPSTDSEAESS
jgi:hypothetical protein